MAKATRAEHEARLNKVYEMLVGGANRRRIWQYVSSEKGKELFDGISLRSVDRLIAEANGLLSSEAEFLRGDQSQHNREIGLAYARLNDIYASARAVMDFQRCLSAVKEISALLGLYPQPAAQTINLKGVDNALLKTVLDAIEANGWKMSDVFEAFLQEIAADHAKPPSAR